MSLIVCQWGGSINADNSLPSPVEEWSNTLALIGPSGPDPAGLLPLVLAPLEAWFTAPHAYISATVALEWLKVNEYNVATGHQITDPSVEQILATPLRGAVVNDYSPPLTSSYRVSIDDGTRNRRARGGWFVPRCDLQIEHNGRFIASRPPQMVLEAQTFLDALNTITDYTVGVWSRVDHSVTAAARVRVGNVPDNVRSRKNALSEAYSVLSL